jgi:hypothetical protein
MPADQNRPTQWRSNSQVDLDWSLQESSISRRNHLWFLAVQPKIRAEFISNSCRCRVVCESVAMFKMLEDETLSIRSLCTIHKDAEDTVEVEATEAHLS